MIRTDGISAGRRAVSWGEWADQPDLNEFALDIEGAAAR
jgi:hypothetical protein